MYISQMAIDFAGPWIFDVLLKVSIVLVLGLFVAFAFRRTSATTKHVVLSSSIFCCLLIPVLSLAVPSWQLPQFSGWLAHSSALAESNSPRISHTARLPASELVASLEVADQTNRSFIQSQTGEIETSSTSDLLANEGESSESILTATSSKPSTFPWPMLWAVGFVVAIIPLVLAKLRVRKLLSNATLMDDEVWTARLGLLSVRLRVGQDIRLYRSDRNLIPVTWGWRRPIILLPKTCDEWSEQRCQSVLLHEMAHIKRADSVTQTITRFVCSVYWFHPLVWILSSKLRFQRELACDDCVVSTGQLASEYANELVEIARSCQSQRSVVAVAMARSPQLKSRIESLFDTRRSHQSSAGKLGLIFMVASFLFAAVISNFEGIATDQQPTAIQENTSEDKLPPGALMRFGSVRFQHPGNVAVIASTFDEGTIISLNYEAVIGWDSKTGIAKWTHQPQFGLLGGSLVFTSAAYGVRPLVRIPETNRFYVIGQDSQFISICDGETGKFERLSIDSSSIDFPQTTRHPFKSIDVSPDGKLIAVGNANGLVVCESDGKAIYSIPNQPTQAIITQTGQGDRMALGGEYSYGVFAPNQEQLAVVTSEQPNTVLLVDVDSGVPKQTIETTGRLVRMDFVPMGQGLVTTERDSSIHFYDTESGERQWSLTLPIENSGESYTHDIKVSPLGDVVAVAAPMGTDNRIRIIDIETGKQIAGLVGHAWKPLSLQFSEDGQTLFSSGWDGSILSWDMQTHQLKKPVQGERTTGISCACPVSNHLAYVTSEGQLKIVDSATRQVV